MTHKKVKFNGEIYWLHGPMFGDNYNISPLDHYSDDGELQADPFNDISFAILEGENIMQYGEKIGDRLDLEDVND